MRYRTVLKSYELNITKPEYAGKQIRLAYFSDLHSCCSAPEQEKLLKLLDRACPQLVLCGGDAIIGSQSHDPSSTVHFLGEIASRWPLLLSVGNHELRMREDGDTGGGVYTRYEEALSDIGLRHLVNESARLVIDDVPLLIYGFDVPRRYYTHGEIPYMPVEEIRAVFSHPECHAVTLLLAHNPSALHTYLDWGADLTLCGHTHGGLMRLGRHRGFISPELFLFPSEAYGHFKKQGKHAIISSGCGEHTLPIRIFNPREIVALKLHFTA